MADGAEVQNTLVGLKYIRKSELLAPKFVRKGAAELSMVSCQVGIPTSNQRLEKMPPLARPGGSPLVLPGGKADTGGCQAQSGVSAAKAAGALGKEAAASNMPSSGRERGGGFTSGHRSMEALWREGSSPGPGTLCAGLRGWAAPRP